MTSNALVLVVCGLTLGVTAYVAANLPQGGAAPDALGARLDDLDRRTASMTAALADLRETVTRIDRRLARGGVRAGGATGSDAGGATSGDPGAGGGAVGESSGAGDAAGRPAGTAAPAGDVALSAAGDAVADRLEKRIEAVARRERARGSDGKWHAPIDELAEELDADEATRSAVVRVLDDGKDRVCALLLTQRGDGQSLVDDYAKAIRDTGDAPGATQAFFKRVLSEKVPGTDETYFVAITHVAEAMEKDLGRHLDAPRMERLRALRVDLLDVKTGHDPVGDAVRERLTK